jgi:aconitate hydratase
VITLDLSTVVSSLSGPKRPHDRIDVKEMKQEFNFCLTNKVRLKHLQAHATNIAQ